MNDIFFTFSEYLQSDFMGSKPYAGFSPSLAIYTYTYSGDRTVATISQSSNSWKGPLSPPEEGYFSRDFSRILRICKSPVNDFLHKIHSGHGLEDRPREGRPSKTSHRTISRFSKMNSEGTAGDIRNDLRPQNIAHVSGVTISLGLWVWIVPLKKIK